MLSSSPGPILMAARTHRPFPVLITTLLLSPLLQPVFDTIEGHVKAWQLRRAGLLPRARDVEMARPAAAATVSKAGISQAEQPRDQLVHNTAPHAILTEDGAAATTLKPRPPRHHVYASSAHPPLPAAVLPASPFDQAAGAAAARPAPGASAASSPAKSQAGAASEEPGGGLIRTRSSARAAVSIYSASLGLGNEDMPPNETCLLPFRQVRGLGGVCRGCIARPVLRTVLGRLNLWKRPSHSRSCASAPLCHTCSHGMHVHEFSPALHPLCTPPPRLRLRPSCA